MPDNSKKVSDIKPLNHSQEVRFFPKSPLFKKHNLRDKSDLVNSTPKKTPPPPHKSFSKGLIFGIIGFVIFGTTLTIASIHNFRKQVVASIETDLNRFRLQAEEFNFLDNNPENYQSLSQEISLDPIQALGVKFLPILKDGFGAYQDIRDLAASSFDLLASVETFSEKAPALFMGGEGDQLLSELESIKVKLDNIAEKNSSLAASVGNFKDFSGEALDFYLPLQANLTRYQKLLDSLFSWLQIDRRLFVMILNPSEIRPGGGFLGSFAELNLRKGALINLNLYDINDIDRNLSLKTVPPEPIQVIASNWRTADANWFFDFPSSASQVLSFAESSDFFKDEEIVFDGVIGVSAVVISDILTLTGPIEISDGTVINQDNFLFEIQKDIQTSRAAKESYPKQILREIAPIIMEKIAALPEDGKQALFLTAKNWLDNKDLVFYFKDPNLEKSAESFNLSGEIYELPADFAGGYLAIVNANLGGAKTDLFIDQDIRLVSQLSEEGLVSNELVIKRKHNGNESEYSWYNTTNQNYLQIFTPAGSVFENFSGGIEKKISSSVNYKKNGYLEDPLVVEIESSEQNFLGYPELSSFEAFGKKIFASWTRVAPGKTSEITFHYTHRTKPIVPGGAYQFVFEKQMGTTSSYHFEIGAPVGYVWQENNLPIFEYHSSNPPGRLILNLTLKRGI